MDFKNKKVLLWGVGLEASHAERLSRDFGHVWYATPWTTEQKFVNYACGAGFAPNIEKVMHPQEYIKKADLVASCNIGGPFWDLPNQFGGGRGEKLEEYRYKFRMIQPLHTRNSICL